jgi:hypothetical protein
MRRIAIAGVLALSTLLLGLPAVWYIEARQVKSLIAAWTERRLAYGFVFAHGTVEVRGFPFHFDVTIKEPVLASVDDQDRWQAPTLRARSGIWRPNLFDYEVAGRFVYRADKADEIDIDAAILRGTVEIANEAVHSASLRAESIHISAGTLGEIVVGSGDGLLSVSPESAADLKSDSANLKLSLHAISVGEGNVSVLKEPIQSINFSLALTGPLPWDGAPDALARWRDAGGTFELRQIAVAWSGLALEGDGTFALDDQMRPEGALTLRLDGLQATLSRLADAGALSSQLAELIGKRVAELGAPDDRVPGRLLIGVTAQNGSLTIQDHSYWTLSPITGP